MRNLRASNRDIAARVAKLESGHDHTASVIEVRVDDIDRLYPRSQRHEGAATNKETTDGLRQRRGSS